MRILQKAFSQFVYGRFYISIAAFLLAIQTSLLFTRQLPSWSLSGFIFFATLFAYNIYYIDLDRPIYKYHKLTAFIAAFAAGACFIFCAPQINWLLLSALVVFGCLYTFASYFPFQLFTKPLIKIVLLTSVWILAVIFLPLEKNIYLSSPLFVLFTLHQFIFVFILNLLFDIKDIEFDEKKRRTSLATKYGKQTSYTIIHLLEMSLIVALCLMIFIERNYLSPYLVPLLIANLALSYCIRKMRTRQAMYPYLVYVDGLMLLQSFLVIFTFYAIRHA